MTRSEDAPLIKGFRDPTAAELEEFTLNAHELRKVKKMFADIDIWTPDLEEVMQTYSLHGPDQEPLSSDTTDQRMSKTILLISSFGLLRRHFDLSQHLQTQGHTVIGAFSFAADSLDEEKSARYAQCVSDVAMAAGVDQVIINGLRLTTALGEE